MKRERKKSCTNKEHARLQEENEQLRKTVRDLEERIAFFEREKEHRVRVRRLGYVGGGRL